MTDQTLLLSDKVISRLPLAKKGQYKVHDKELKGFMVLIGKRQKSFMAQGDFWRDGVREFSVRKKLGDVGDLTTRDARSRAKEVLGAIAKGMRPGEETKIKPGSITLRQAWERYLDAHMIRKGRSAGTIENYRDHMERLFEDWLDKPLARLGRQPELVAERHDKITKENGAYIANGAMRSLRAVYNHARKTNRDLPPENPTLAVDWNQEERRDTGMGPGDLPAWLEELSVLDNTVRREFHLLTLLSGSRPTALKNVRIEHVDFRARVLHVPKPKGGEERAFDIPLSRAIIRCIIRAIRIGRILYPDQAKIWLFPADSETGHLVEHKEERDVLSKWGNDLRQTYRTIAQSVGVSKLDIHLLMNHSLPGVNEGYITREKLLNDLLRKQQERISAVVLERAGKIKNGLALNWLRSAKASIPVGHTRTQPVKGKQSKQGAPEKMAA
ncbi:MAG: integrase arm-type DNA-binding domain-containing protein [Polyangiaceae bacterium]|nr:integrase arm-type DNA-binding domain-containing protein [Polyangiaceae bacterium]